MRLQGLVAVTVEITVMLQVLPCSSLDKYQHCGARYWLHNFCTSVQLYGVTAKKTLYLILWKSSKLIGKSYLNPVFIGIWASVRQACNIYSNHLIRQVNECSTLQDIIMKDSYQILRKQIEPHMPVVLPFLALLLFCHFWGVKLVKPVNSQIIFNVAHRLHSWEIFDWQVHFPLFFTYITKNKRWWGRLWTSKFDIIFLNECGTAVHMWRPVNCISSLAILSYLSFSHKLNDVNNLWFRTKVRVCSIQSSQ